MQITRRSFIKYCTASASALGLAPGELERVCKAVEASATPSVLWLQGSGCSGCSISFLNYAASNSPVDAAEVLIRSVKMVYHPTLSAGSGQSVVSEINHAANYLLVVEGGVPAAFGGHACVPWSDAGREVTFEEAVKTLGAKAVEVMCVGACAAYGGISAMGSNPASVAGVQKAIGRNTINIAGCPPHPNWIVSTLISLLQGKTVRVDASGRPTAIYGGRMCEECPYHHRGEANGYGENGRCLERLACRGRSTGSTCPSLGWNNGVNWCVGAGAPCQGCTDPFFPQAGSGEGRGSRGRGGARGPGGSNGRRSRGFGQGPAE